MLITQWGNTSRLNSFQHGKLAIVLFSILLNAPSWNLGQLSAVKILFQLIPTDLSGWLEQLWESVQRIPWGSYCWLYIIFTCCLSEHRRLVEGRETRQRTVSFLPIQLRAKEREKDIKDLPDSRAGGWQSNCHCVCGEWGRKRQQKLRKIHLPEERDHSDKQLIYIQRRFSAKEGEAMDNKSQKDMSTTYLKPQRIYSGSENQDCRKK